MVSHGRNVIGSDGKAPASHDWYASLSPRESTHSRSGPDAFATMDSMSTAAGVVRFWS
jgi:hypothetical protein